MSLYSIGFRLESKCGGSKAAPKATKSAEKGVKGYTEWQPITLGFREKPICGTGFLRTFVLFRPGLIVGLPLVFGFASKSPRAFSRLFGFGNFFQTETGFCILGGLVGDFGSSPFFHLGHFFQGDMDMDRA